MEPSRERIFSRMAGFSLLRPRFILLGALLLAALSALLVSRLQFQSDVLHLLPRNAPQTQALVSFLREFGSGDSLLVVLERESRGPVDPLVPFAQTFADSLMATGEFTEIVGRSAPELKEKMAREFLRRALFYLSEEDLLALEARLSDRGIEEQVRFLRSRLSAMFASPLAAHDPLDLLPLLRKNLPLPSLLGEPDGQGAFLSADRKLMLLIAKPRGSAPDVDYDARLVKKVKEAEAAARQAYVRKNGPPGEALMADLRVGLTGGFVHALEDSRMIKRELIWNFSLSLTGVLALTLLAFRSGASLLYAFFPLLISPLLTLGLFSPFLGRLNESTGAFSAIILGLSIDFIILLYSRYLEERGGGAEISPALERTLGAVGPAVLTGAVTTTAGYYALLLSGFPGVRELGILTGTGILVSLGCALFFFPALVAWRERGRGLPPPRGAGAFPWGLERLGPLSLKFPSLVLLLCAALTLGIGSFASQVNLNNDPRRLRPANLPSLALEGRVQEKMEEGLETVILLVRTPGAEEALEAQETWRRMVEKGISSGLPVSRHENLAALIPPLSRQERTRDWIAARPEAAFDPRRVEERLKEALRREGLRQESFEDGLRALREFLGGREPLAWQEAEKSPLKTIGDRFLKKEGDGFLSIAYLHIRPDFWDHPQAGPFLEGLRASRPGVSVSSPRLVREELEDLMGRESWKILLLALAAVSLLLYWDFRSWPLTLFSLLPVVLSSVWTLGLMGMLGIDLNFMNLVVFTMVLGIGVDYGVHILHRGRQALPGLLAPELEKVGRGVTLAALTTLAGFGSLVFSSYPGLRSMGAVALMGVGFSLLFSLTLVPVLLEKWLRKNPPP